MQYLNCWIIPFTSRGFWGSVQASPLSLLYDSELHLHVSNFSSFISCFFFLCFTLTSSKIIFYVWIEFILLNCALKRNLTHATTNISCMRQVIKYFGNCGQAELFGQLHWTNLAKYLYTYLFLLHKREIYHFGINWYYYLFFYLLYNLTWSTVLFFY